MRPAAVLCAAVAMACGGGVPVDDGAPLLDVGGPPVAEECSGVGCLVQCEPSCPGGWALSEDAACVAEATDLLVQDLATTRVFGSIRLNGAVPVVDPQLCKGDAVEVLLTDEVAGVEASVRIPCAAGDFSFSARVPRGRYRVRVRDVAAGPGWHEWGLPATNLPAWQYVLPEPLDARGTDPVALSIDLRTVWMTGEVRMNGSVPTLDPAVCRPSLAGAWVEMWTTEGSGPFSFVSSPCNSERLLLAGEVYEGVYNAGVVVLGPERDSPFYEYMYLGGPVVAVDAARSHVVFDVPTARVSGRILVNGAPAPCGAAHWVDLQLADGRYQRSFDVECTDGVATFGGETFQGEYDVYVSTGAYGAIHPPDRWTIDGDGAHLDVGYDAAAVTPTVRVDGVAITGQADACNASTRWKGRRYGRVLESGRRLHRSGAVRRRRPGLRHPPASAGHLSGLPRPAGAVGHVTLRRPLRDRVAR